MLSLISIFQERRAMFPQGSYIRELIISKEHQLNSIYQFPLLFKNSAAALWEH